LIIKEEIKDLRMILVCGPRITPDSLGVPSGVEVKGYVPSLYDHFAACDLAIVQGGATSTLELTALRTPFLYFPTEGHFEQAQVSERLTRHKAGVKMLYSQTTPESLAEKVISYLDKELIYSNIPTDGARRATQLINQFL
jgi:UDP:flavonoid glycosyltransferase YjiC (YdhE family)